MDTNINKIRALNDNFRQKFTGGRVLITRGVAELPIDKQLEIIEKVRNFNDFNKNNDPNGSTTLGLLTLTAQLIFGKLTITMLITNILA